MAFSDRQRVRWDGFPGPSHLAGDEGRVLSSTDRYCQVMWTTGSQTGRVEAVPNEFLADARRSAVRTSVDDSLEFVDESPLSRTAVRSVVAEQGVGGLLRYASTSGGLWSTGDMSETIIEFAQRQASENAEVVGVLAHLDPEDRVDFIAAVASAVLLEASKGDQDV